jgi:catechol 2,3-dioxygenase
MDGHFYNTQEESMTEKIENQTTAVNAIHPKTRVGYVSLTVASLENQIAFYQDALGFQQHWREDKSTGLGAGGEDLVHLVEQPDVKRYTRVTGLYHLAVLYPGQSDLARAIARLFARKITNHPTDHIMTKSTYLDDPEGNGIELYAESPEDGEWFMENGGFYARRSDGTLSNGREPLDVRKLFEQHLKTGQEIETPLPQETRIGHVHLHVSDLNEAVDFYNGVIGFDVMGMVRTVGMAFVSAGGYHHHVGLNTWQGQGAPTPPPDAVGLRYFTVVLPDRAELDRVVTRLEDAGHSTTPKNGGVFVRDPAKNGVLLTT